MRQFFKMLFASMLGFILGGILLLFLLVGIVGALVSKSENKEKEIPAEQTILLVNLDGPITDRGSDNPFENFDINSLSSKKDVGLVNLLAGIKAAESDDNISGMLLEVPSIQIGMASLSEIRNALIQFRKSGKFIYAYSESYSVGAYYLATAANKIVLNPQGELSFVGLSSSFVSLKGALEKLEVEPVVIRHGKFKSAVEPFIADHISESNRKQMRVMQSAAWNEMLSGICKERKLDAPTLNRFAETVTIRNANDALKNKMVDALQYRNDLISELTVKTGRGRDAKPRLTTLADYSADRDLVPDGKGPDKIALIYASGEIESGKGEEKSIGGDRLAEAIRDARLDDKVKALVLRVNSPGGSALASDVIWHELVEAKKTKPVVVSMGDVAASGGYYISCPATRIFASPLTITGSIGVFGLFFNVDKMLRNKLGILTDTIRTHRLADLGSSTRPITEEEKAILQQSVEEVYSTFIQRVSDGRKIKTADVDSLGQGRVWLGVNAKNLGLVDAFGGLNDALAEAAKLAKLSQYRLMELPRRKPAFEQILGSISGDVEERMARAHIGEAYPYYRKIKSVLHQQGIMARMDLDVNWH